MWRDRSVLLVEDDEVVRRLLVQALEGELGAATVVGTDGVQALARASQLQPTVIVLDLRLPGIDGFEVARALRSDPATAASRIIALTAMTPVQPARERALAVGCDAFIAKPFRIDELLDLVHRYLLESDAEREAERDRPAQPEP